MASNKTYLITGATGFIGSLLARRLVGDKKKTHLILRKQANLWRIKDIVNKLDCHISDLTEMEKIRKIIKKIKPAVIYHLATYGAYPYQDEPDKIIETNILGTWNLLKAASSVDYELFVNTGSSSEYGFKQKPMKETDLLEPASYYAVSKCSQTLLCFYTARHKKKPVVTLRPFSVYGPYEEPARLIPTLMRALYFKKNMNLVSGEIARDMIYVDDVVDAYLLVEQLKKYPGEIFNIGTGIRSTIKHIVEKAAEVTGERTSFKWGRMKPRIWDTANWVADISKSKQLLGWSPQIDLKRGLSLAWEWFKANHQLYRKRV